MPTTTTTTVLHPDGTSITVTTTASAAPDAKTAATRHAYVGSYTGFKAGELGWVGSTTPGEGISIFAFDEASGKLAPTALGVVAQDAPTWLEVSPCGGYLVATHELSHHLGTPEAGLAIAIGKTRAGRHARCS